MIYGHSTMTITVTGVVVVNSQLSLYSQYLQGRNGEERESGRRLRCVFLPSPQLSSLSLFHLFLSFPLLAFLSFASIRFHFWIPLPSFLCTAQAKVTDKERGDWERWLWEGQGTMTVGRNRERWLWAGQGTSDTQREEGRDGSEEGTRGNMRNKTLQGGGCTTRSLSPYHSLSYKERKFFFKKRRERETFFPRIERKKETRPWWNKLPTPSTNLNQYFLTFQPLKKGKVWSWKPNIPPSFSKAEKGKERER